MSVVRSTEDLSASQKALVIEVPTPAVDAEVQRVVKEYSRKIQLPGFRRGKTPAAIIRKRFREEIDQEVLERLVPRYWKQAQAEQELEPLLQPLVEEVELKDGEPLTFKATVDLRPEIEVSDDRSFDLPDAEVLVGEAEIDEFIERMRENSAPWNEVDRAAARGDQVVLKILEKNGGSGDEATAAPEGSETSEGAEASEGEGAGPEEWQDLTIEVGQEGLWEELTLAVTGLSKGQSGSFEREELQMPAAEGEEPPPPKERQFDLQIVEVRERYLPELDDEAAKGLGFDTVEELRQRVHDGVLSQKQQERSKEREQKMLEQLVERHPMELPARVVESEIQTMMREYLENLQRSGLSPEQVGTDWQEMQERMKPQAEKRVHARLAIDAVAAHDEIAISEEELEIVLAQIGRQEKQSPTAVRIALDRNGQLPALQAQLRREKTVKLLLGEDPSFEEPQDGEHNHEAAHDEEE